MKIDDANAIFRAFADETRLRILHLLTLGELCVCEIMEALRLPQSKVSRHLAHLRDAGMVEDRKEGLWVYYSLSAPRSALQQSIVSCVGCCFGDVPTLQADLKRARAALSRRACGAEAGVSA